MENASKALLIAGAIIVVLVIIAIGMLILNSSTGIFNRATSSMSDKEKTLFNQTFTMYEGTISGSQVKSLLQEVISNNNNPENGAITINSDDEKPTKSTEYKKEDGTVVTIKSAANYKVECKYGSGLVNRINISEV